MSLVAIDSTILTTKAGAPRPARMRRGNPAGYWTLVLFRSPSQLSLKKSDATRFDFVNRADKFDASFCLTLAACGRFENLAHAPANICFDRRIGFIGSYKLDPRSSKLDTEMGVLFDWRCSSDASLDCW